MIEYEEYGTKQGKFYMAVTQSQIEAITKDITQAVEQAYHGLSLFFVVHRIGKMREAISLAEHEIVSHRAGNAARAIIRKHSVTEKSSFLGLAITSESKFLGFGKKDHLLGLFNINIDEFESEKEARTQIYHLAWHAIDLYEIRQQPQYRKKFKDGPMVPKRSSMNAAKASLQADAFTIALSKLKGENGLLVSISEKRARNSLEANNNFKPEDYPSVIAIDACKIAVQDLLKEKINKNDFVKRARQLSVDVGHAFDEENIRQWWNFTIPAQDMAWRGFSNEKILGAAIHTSNDPYVRSVGYLVQEVTNIEPASLESLENSYNAFIEPEILMGLHKEMVDIIFEDAVSRGLEEASNRAFLNAANKLNESLTEGNILGWCSNALQDAAQAFERALLNGAPPDQAARMQFEGNKSHPKWETLKKLGKDIVDQKRQGFAVTMGHIAEICHNNPAFSPVLDSLKITMNDPSYIRKLEAANDINLTPNFPKFAPLGPAPKAAAPNTPIPNAPALGPSLGGNNRAKQIMHQRLMEARREQENQDTKNSSDEHQ